MSGVVVLCHVGGTACIGERVSGPFAAFGPWMCLLVFNHHEVCPGGFLASQKGSVFQRRGKNLPN